eukprot:SAG11_NODE_1153_length_5662_cov_51.111810_3_plen_457_part_00
MQQRYELWSRLLKDSGRDVLLQASWADYVEDQDHAVAGLLPNNTELWYKVATQAHEFRFYRDVTPNWSAILDIANTAHEWNMARFHRPGSWAFMDMLEAGVTDNNGRAYLSFEQSKSHVALWVLMAQPLHLGLDLRNVSAELLGVISNEEVLALHADRLGKMGIRAQMSDGRMNGTQVWARELSDGSRLVGLLNLGGGAGASSADTCSWERKSGGYFQSGPRGNFACYKESTVPQMKAACCSAGLDHCTGFNTPSATHIGGCAKHDSAGGWVNASGQDDFIIAKGHPRPVPPPARRICVAWGDIGLNPQETLFVRDLWQRKSLGSYAKEFCMDSVKGHDMALLHVDSKSCQPALPFKSDDMIAMQGRGVGGGLLRGYLVPLLLVLLSKDATAVPSVPTGPSSTALALQARLSAAKTGMRIAIPAGEYVFSNSSLLISNKQDLTVLGNGATLVFYCK